MARRRVVVPYPPDVISEIDKIAGHGHRTAFLMELAKREIKLNRQRNALRTARGSWKSKDHPELAEGVAKWIREIRRESLKRYKKIERRREGE